MRNFSTYITWNNASSKSLLRIGNLFLCLQKKLHKAEVYLSHYSKRFIDVLSRVNDVLKLEESLSRLIGDGLIIKSSCIDRAVY